MILNKVKVSGFRDQNSGYRGQGPGVRGKGSGFRVKGDALYLRRLALPNPALIRLLPLRRAPRLRGLQLVQPGLGLKDLRIDLRDLGVWDVGVRGSGLGVQRFWALQLFLCSLACLLGSFALLCSPLL